LVLVGALKIELLSSLLRLAKKLAICGEHAFGEVGGTGELADGRLSLAAKRPPTLVIAQQSFPAVRQVDRVVGGDEQSAAEPLVDFRKRAVRRLHMARVSARLEAGERRWCLPTIR